MNRIICDICGCEYAETSERCPICSYPRQGTEKTAEVAGDTERTKVKGGRFSSKNVKKRRKAQRKAAAVGRERSDKPLLIVITLLLVAIVLVSLYIALRFFWGGGSAFGLQRGQNGTSTTAPADTTGVPTVPCAGIMLESSVIALDEPGQEHVLALTVLPEGTTDVLTFATSDAGVVSVSDDGKLIAVGPGQAVITITCGSVVKECTVVCWFQEETTAPAETTAPPETTAATEAPKPTEPRPQTPRGLTLDQSDVSFFAAGEAFTIRVKLDDKFVSRSDVTWTSSDSNVATVENGTVTAVGKGTVTITASYEGKKASCIVRCRFENTADTEDREDQENQENPDWRASHTDVSIKVGESFRLTVINGSGKTADAIWTMSIDGVVSIDGKTVTGRAPGTVTLKTTVDGITLTCIVRVR